MTKEVKEKFERMRKVDLLEEAILELEKGKQVMMKDEFLEEPRENQMNHLDSLQCINVRIKKLKDKIDEIMSSAPNDEHKLYLSQIIDLEKPKFGSNNLILAPVGSGKSTLINELIKNQTGKILMLVSNTALKDKVCPNNDDLRKQEGQRKFTSGNKKRFGDKTYEIHVMTYAEFGKRVYTNNDFLNDVVQIHCDEIHSLPVYQWIDDDVALSHAMKCLFNPQKGIQIFYYTATNEHLLILESKRPGTFKSVKTFDYRNHPDIKKYITLSKYEINHIEQIRPHLKARLESFNYFGHKGLAFNRTISGQERIEQIAIEEGFTPLMLWSINNEEKPMTEIQIKAREELLNTGIIPEPYNLLIINSAMQEGWNLTDRKVKLAIINTTNETEHIQALGRVRQDMDVLVYRTNETIVNKDAINISEKYINQPLTTELKNELCKELNIVDSKGRISKWPTVKTKLIESGYDVLDTQRRINKKATKVSIITKL